MRALANDQLVGAVALSDRNVCAHIEPCGELLCHFPPRALPAHDSELRHALGRVICDALGKYRRETLEVLKRGPGLLSDGKFESLRLMSRNDDCLGLRRCLSGTG